MVRADREAEDRAAQAAAVRREIDDLEAQQSMARSASSLLEPSWWQVWVGFGGFLGLLATLVLNVLSLRATHRAIRAQGETAKHQLRAYVGVEDLEVEAIAGKLASVRIETKNFGQTPAYKLRERGTIKFRRHGAPLPTKFDVWPSSTTLNPGDTAPTVVSDDDGELTPADLTALALGDVPGGGVLVVIVELTYETMGETHTTSAAGEFWGFSGTVENEMLPDLNWAD